MERKSETHWDFDIRLPLTAQVTNSPCPFGRLLFFSIFLSSFPFIVAVVVPVFYDACVPVFAPELSTVDGVRNDDTTRRTQGPELVALSKNVTRERERDDKLGPNRGGGP